MILEFRRLLSRAALLALACAAGLALAPAALADDDDPPARVGRVALLQGTVSFHPSPDDQWIPAELNYPVAQSTALWADTGSVIEIEIGAARVRLASGTELDVVQLDDQNVILSVPQGRVEIALHGLGNGERYDIQTPRGDVDLLSDGNYRVIAGTDVDPTRVASFSGQAQLVGAASAITVGANQEMIAAAGTPVAYTVATALQDAFDSDFFRAAALIYARPVPAYAPPVPGVAVLSQYGVWREDPRYGYLWFPTRVEVGWQPYRRGHWSFIAPWGYTWIDDAPWGFAPFHYGRWVMIGDSWAWVPVERGVLIEPGYRPVYAPAMVTFIGNPAALTVGIAGVAISVGWVPLGPGEPWHPWYPHSDRYLRQANVVNVNRTVITNITNTTIINNTTYINQRAAVVVPQTAFATGRPVAQAAYHVPPAALAKPIEPARPATIEKVLPPPAASAAPRQAVLPPAPKLAAPHPPAASAAAFHAHPQPAVGPRSAIPTPGTNAVPKGTVIAPAARPLAPRPASDVQNPGAPEAKPAEPAKPEAAKPPAQRPEAPKPAVVEPRAAEPVKPEASKPSTPAPLPEAAKPEPRRLEPPKPAPLPEAAKPEPQRLEPPKPAPHPEAAKPEPQRLEPPKPAPLPEAAKPEPQRLEPPKPAPHPEAAKPEPQRLEPPKPAPHPEAAKPEPQRLEPPKPAPHPEAAKPEPQRLEPPKPAPHPEAAKPEPQRLEPPKPAPHPEAAKPEPHKPGEPPAKDEQKKPD